MGLFNGFMGNASEYPIEKIRDEIEHILVPDERIEKAFKVIRHGVVFANKRMILIDKQGVSKIEYLSIPYKSITRFARKSAGIMDLDAELKIWLSGCPEPIIKKFNKETNINHVYTILSQYILG